MKKIIKLRRNLVFNIISAIVVLLFVFSWIVSAIGYISFTNAFKREYAETTYHIARTATTLVNGDNIDKYLENGGTSSDYKISKSRLDIYCDKMNVSLVYVIKVDTLDYGSFTSVFNSVGKDTPYTPWEIGYKQDTTNDEYAEIYKDIYENGREYGTVYRTKNLKGAPAHITTLVPIKDSSDKVVSVMCIQRPMHELTKPRREFLINTAISAVILSVLVAYTASDYIRKQFVIPLRKVSDETARFAKNNKKGEQLGKVSRIKEISSLASAIDKMEDDMIKNIDNLTSITAEKERMGAELSIANTIQSNSIPHIFPAFPHRKEFDIYASMTPAKEVGGDFYNFFLIDDDHLAIVIADVSGKGIPAALFMMVINILISDRTYMGGTPAEILTFVNDNICDHNQADMFVTVWLGILEISTGKITATNAGHDDPAVYRKNGKFEILKSKHGLVVGAMKGIKYKDFEIQLDKGDKIFLYTDGLPEATTKDKKMLTLAGMLDILNENKHKKPQQILESINRSVDEFVGDAPQFDDLTMMCLELSEYDDNSLSIEAKNENLQAVTEFVDSILEENDCSPKAQMQIDLAVEEVFVNIANYAYGESTGVAEISASVEAGEVTIVFKDSGTPYNPLEKAEPDTTLSAEERQIGGLGIFLVKKNMDDVSYTYENGKNVLSLKKKI